MIILKIISSIILYVIPLLSWGQTHTEDYVPYRDVEATDSGIVVTYTFRGGIHQIDPLHDGAKFWKIPGFGLNDNATEPGFPFRWDSFTIPDNAEVQVTLLDSVYTDTLFALAPAYPPLLNSDTIGYTPERVPLITPYTGFYPNMAVLKGDIQSYRGQGIVRVATLPVQYNYQTGTVRAFSRIKYLVSFMDVNTRAKIRGRNYVSERADNHISLSDHFLENATLNYRLSNNGRRNIQTRTGVEPAELDNRSYLIVTTNDFLDAVNDFAEWKRTKGFNVIVESRNSWNNNVDSVKNVIRYHYNNENNLYYILIVGDISTVPCNPFIYNEDQFVRQVTSDIPYACLSDNLNYIPDILIGRVPVSNDLEAIQVLSKIFDYEKTPISNSWFYNNFTTISMFEDLNPVNSYEDSRGTLTSEEIFNYISGFSKSGQRIYYLNGMYTNPLHWNNNLYANGETIPIYLQDSLIWTGNKTDIINRINEGTFLVIYIGHGDYNSWLTPSFSNYDIDSLYNENKYPVVLSMSCKTGQFDYSGDCVAEHFLRKTNGGAVAVFAPSVDTYFGITEMITEYCIDAIWPEPGLHINWRQDVEDSLDIQKPLYEMGKIIDQSMYKMSCFNMSHTSSLNDNSHNYIFYQQLHRMMFNLLGDPSMMIYTNQPIPVTNPSIRVNNNIISVQTTDGDARISFYTPGTTPIVDSYLGNSVDYSTTADSVIICIDRHNCIPYVVTYHKNEFIQNETITDSRTYVGKNIKLGRNVTNTKPIGDVIIDGADVLFQGGNVEILHGTIITNSSVIINPQ